MVRDDRTREMTNERALSEFFLQRAPRASAPHGDAQRDELERALADMWERALAEWPGLNVDVAEFMAFVAARATDATELATLRAGDLYIACACLAQVAGAVQAFRQKFWPKLQGVLRARGVSNDRLADVEQDVWEKLFLPKANAAPTLASYAGRGDLRSFLRSIGTRTAGRLGQREDRRAGEPGGDEKLAQLPAPGDDPEIEALKRLYRDEFAQAFRRALAALTVRQRNLLRQHFIDGLHIDELGTIYRVHRATAARWLGAARADLFEGTKKELGRAVGASDSAAESIIRLVNSQLEFSIHQYLA